MAKALVGKVISTKMTGSVIVEVTRRTPHPLYKKLLKRSKKYTVSPDGKEVKEGNYVKIVETKKVAKNKNFKIEEVLK
ncbi:MAG TPA: 30S ribosomal protein S17 [Patescibacteria group bacterium]